jgi:hypothetical protein
MIVYLRLISFYAILCMFDNSIFQGKRIRQPIGRRVYREIEPSTDNMLAEILVNAGDFYYN